MNWTKTPPTEPGFYYWKIFLDHNDYNVLDVFKEDGRLFVADADGDISVRELGGFWGGHVPAPGTTWNVEQIAYYIENLQGKSHASAAQLLFNAAADITDPQSGIAATTARRGKEQG